MNEHALKWNNVPMGMGFWSCECGFTSRLKTRMGVMEHQARMALGESDSPRMSTSASTRPAVNATYSWQPVWNTATTASTMRESFTQMFDRLTTVTAEANQARQVQEERRRYNVSDIADFQISLDQEQYTMRDGTEMTGEEFWEQYNPRHGRSGDDRPVRMIQRIYGAALEWSDGTFTYDYDRPTMPPVRDAFPPIQVRRGGIRYAEAYVDEAPALDPPTAYFDGSMEANSTISWTGVMPERQMTAVEEQQLEGDFWDAFNTENDIDD